MAQILKALKRWLDLLKGHRTMILTGIALLSTLTVLFILLLGGEDRQDEAELLLSHLITVGGFVLMLAGSAQLDKLANGINSKLSK